MWLIWLIAAGVFFIAEIITVGFLIFWLGVGAILAMLVSLVTDNILIQFAVFVFSSIALIFLTKPLVSKYISKEDTIPTNSYSLIGKKGKVIKDIGENIGQVKVSEEVWSAISENSAPINAGTEIEVLKIDGVKLVVKPV
ncbi:MAG: NfeD family protein [Clostridia bacterium]|nr:NfeD family protein [Clostridia bacterium]